MDDLPSSQLYLGENSGSVPMMRALERAYLCFLAAIGSISLAAILIVAVTASSSMEAGRIAGSEGGYGATLVSAMAATQTRRLP